MKPVQKAARAADVCRVARHSRQKDPADLIHSVRRLFDYSVSHLQIGIGFPLVFNSTRASPQHGVSMRRFA